MGGIKKLSLPGKVFVREVGPRDGLQNEKAYVPTEDKIRFIKLAAEAGIKQIEATSFVNPEAVPQMRDAELLLRSLPPLGDAEISVLVLNLKGARRAIDAGVKTLVANISAGESHSRSNANCTRKEAAERIEKIADLAHSHKINVRASISVVFGCTFDGPIELKETAPIVERILAAGIREITLSDTAGLGSPDLIYRTCAELKGIFPQAVFALHLHDFRGLGLPNCLAGLLAGIDTLETSIGGLGGCPVIQNAPGNVATEDLVYMLHAMGIETGIDLDKVLAAAGYLARVLNHSLFGRQFYLG